MHSAAPRCSALLVSTVLAFIVFVSTALAQAPGATPAAPPSGGNESTTQQTGSQGNGLPQSSVPGKEPGAQEPAAQQPDAEPPANDQGSMFVFKKQVEEVVLHATVVDEQNRVVSGLERSAFTVFDGGVSQPITSFRREDVPVAMGIVIDNSGSMREKRNEITKAVVNLIRASNPRDQIFVVNFGQDPYLDQDFTSDVNLLQAALRQVSARGSTALYDAVVASAVHLRSSPLEKKILLVITDGQDNMSQETLQEASHRLQQANGPTVYAIGLLGGGMGAAGQDALQRLADRSGGVAYFPASLDQVDNITRSVAHDIRNQYMIAYKPRNQNAQPGYQSVRVEAQAPGYGKLTVRTRTGYYPPSKQ